MRIHNNLVYIYIYIYIYIYTTCIQYTMCTALADTYISAIYSTNLFVVVSIAQLIEVADSVVLGDVVEVVSSIHTVGHENIFSIFRHS